MFEASNQTVLYLYEEANNFEGTTTLRSIGMGCFVQGLGYGREPQAPSLVSYWNEMKEDLKNVRQREVNVLVHCGFNKPQVARKTAPGYQGHDRLLLTNLPTLAWPSALRSPGHAFR